MRDFKTVFFRILFVIVIVVCVWQCNAYKKGKTAGVTAASSKVTTTTTTIGQVQDITADVSPDIVISDESAD